MKELQTWQPEQAEEAKQSVAKMRQLVGDLNGDGKVNVADVLALLNLLSQLLGALVPRRVADNDSEDYDRSNPENLRF